MYVACRFKKLSQMGVATVPFAQRDGKDPSPTLRRRCHSDHPVTVWGTGAAFSCSYSTAVRTGRSVSISATSRFTLCY